MRSLTHPLCALPPAHIQTHTHTPSAPARDASHVWVPSSTPLEARLPYLSTIPSNTLPSYSCHCHNRPSLCRSCRASRYLPAGCLVQSSAAYTETQRNATHTAFRLLPTAAHACAIASRITAHRIASHCTASTPRQLVAPSARPSRATHSQLPSHTLAVPVQLGL